MVGSRLSVIDEMFLWTHNGLGLPVVMQGIWRTDGVVGAAELEELCCRVAAGPLGRRVRRPHMPGARPEFVADPGYYPVEIEPVPIPAGAVVAWADAQGAVPVDPQRGPGWRIAAARDADGGTVVSVTCSHVLADALGLITALDDAMQGRPCAAAPPSRRSDVADAAGTVTRVVRGIAGVVGGALTSAQRRAELRDFKAPSGSRGTAGSERRISTVILDVEAARWDAAAEDAGGTPNSLFLAVVGELCRRAGESGPVTLSVPMSVRAASDAAANAVAMVAVTVTPDSSLAELRRQCRDAFESPPMSGPPGVPHELLQVIPDRLAQRLAGSPGQRDALCSNIGTVNIARFGSHRCTGLALRAVHPGATPAQLGSTPTRLSGYLHRHGRTYSLALVGFESIDAHDLRRRAVHALEHFGLGTTSW